MRASNAALVPISASSDMAPATSASRASRPASSTASAPRPAMRCVPFSSARPSLVSSASGRTPAACSASRRRHPAPGRHGLALTDQAGRHVRERSEIARRPHRALLRHDGVHAPIQARHQGLDHARSHAGGPARQRRREQQHHRARFGLGERGTDATGVAQHEVALQRGALRRRNHHVLELADAGGDAVDRLGAAGEPIDECAAGRQPRGGGGPQRDLAAPPRHVLDVAECERPAVAGPARSDRPAFRERGHPGHHLILGDRRQSPAARRPGGRAPTRRSPPAATSRRRRS